jgi:pimeloyl-ACP methyl ester carboxylesterase
MRSTPGYVRKASVNARVAVIENNGHWVLEENPKEITDALMNFL